MITINNYSGHYIYDYLSAYLFAPNSIGIYYCGYLDQNGMLKVLYVGRARGEGVSIKSRIYNHLKEDFWPGVTHFGFIVCSDISTIDTFEAIEILRLQPIYNQRGKNL